MHEVTEAPLLKRAHGAAAAGDWQQAYELFVEADARHLLEPPDLAGAYFRLARSLSGAGREAESRRAVLQSLELAPDYRDAQRLLLEVAQ